MLARQRVALHDLEVVVAHGDPGARLERRQVAVARAHEPRLPAGVLVVLAYADLQLAHPPEVPRERAPGAPDVDAVAALLPHRDARRRQRAARTGGEPQECRRHVLVTDGPRGPSPRAKWDMVPSPGRGRSVRYVAWSDTSSVIAPTASPPTWRARSTP